MTPLHLPYDESPLSSLSPNHPIGYYDHLVKQGEGVLSTKGKVSPNDAEPQRGGERHSENSQTNHQYVRRNPLLVGVKPALNPSYWHKNQLKTNQKQPLIPTGAKP